MITLKQIQIRISEAIQQSGKTQYELAKACGVSQQAISSYLKCKKLPSLDTFANLCKVLDEDTNYILCQNQELKESK